VQELYASGYMPAAEYNKQMAQAYPEQAAYWQAQTEELERLKREAAEAEARAAQAQIPAATFITPTASREMAQTVTSGFKDGLEWQLSAQSEVWLQIAATLSKMEAHHSPGAVDAVLRPITDRLVSMINSLPGKVPPEVQQYFNLAGSVQDAVWLQITKSTPKNAEEAYAWAKNVLSIMVPATIITNLVGVAVDLAHPLKSTGIMSAINMTDKALGMTAITSMLMGAPVAYGVMPWYKRYLDKSFRTYMLGWSDALRLSQKGIWTREKAADVMTQYGIRDDDILALMDDYPREPSIRDLQYMVEDMEPDPTWLAYKLKRAGYAAEDIPAVMRGFTLRLMRTEFQRLRDTAVTDFIDGAIDEATLRADLSQLPLSETRRELWVAYAKLRKAREDRKAAEKKAEQDAQDAEAKRLEFLKTTQARLYDEAMTDFIDGWTNEAQLTANLETVLVDKSLVSVYVAEAKLRRDRERRAEAVKIFTLAFQKDIITEDEFRAQLKAIPMDTVKIEQIIQLETLRKVPKPKAG
jgi:hypothetical protein